MDATTQGKGTLEAGDRRVGIRAVLDRLYSSGEAEGDNGRSYQVFPTSLPREEGEALRDLAVREGVQRTLETGFALGISALFLCDALLARGGDAARHVAVDPYQEAAFGDAGLRTVREAGIADLVQLHRVESQLVLPALVQQGESFDLAFIDGDHKFDGAFLDLYYCNRLVRPGGLIVLDDLWLPAVRIAAAFFERNLGYQRVAEIPQERGPRRRRPFWRSQRPNAARIVVYRRPEAPDQRRWDNFVPFW